MVETLHYSHGISALGEVLMASSSQGVCAILLGDHLPTMVEDLKKRFAGARLVPAGTEDTEVLESVVRLIDEPCTASEVSLDVRGTSFQQQVWEALARIPVGQTATYSQVAVEIGKPNACRAVANACAANPLAVAIPCHRVIASNGGLGGYRWGTDRKQALLNQEQLTFSSAAS